MSRSKIGLSEEEIENRIAFAKVHSTYEFAEKYNVCYATALKFYKVYGVKKWKRKGERGEMILYLAEKFTCESIAELLGCTTQNISQLVTKWGNKAEQEFDE